MEGAVKGSADQVKIELTNTNTAIAFDYVYVTIYKDSTIKRKVEGLESDTSYFISLKGGKAPDFPITEIKGSFKTATSEE
jgi:hypothetical protein